MLLSAYLKDASFVLRDATFGAARSHSGMTSQRGHAHHAYVAHSGLVL